LPRNTKLTLAAIVALAALIAAVVLASNMLSDGGGGGSVSEIFTATTPAAAPFDRFDEARVAVDDHCIRVLVATDAARRTQGLRDVRDLSPYEGMLFVWPEDTQTRFTMANTLIPLDITWFALDGSSVDSTRMEPCPDPEGKNCPLYESEDEYRYALEQPAGSAGSGSLGACS
jgi:uncharacterized membrane protein (UPF0127 family)